MNTWIALLRGINVGGHHKLPMKELVAELEELGLSDVKTYIQSGNAVFRSPESDPSELGERIASAIRSSHGFEPKVMVLSRDELRAAAEANPFPQADAAPTTVHLFFLAEPATPDMELADAVKAPTEELVLTEKVLYLHTPDGLGRSKLGAKIDKVLGGVQATARNWRTVGKILEMAER